MSYLEDPRNKDTPPEGSDWHGRVGSKRQGGASNGGTFLTRPRKRKKRRSDRSIRRSVLGNTPGAGQVGYGGKKEGIGIQRGFQQSVGVKKISTPFCRIRV